MGTILKRFVLLLATILLTTVPASAGSADKAGALGDVTEEWCLDEEAKEIYTVSDGIREPLVVSEAVVMGDEVIDKEETERIFHNGLVEAIDGADALSTSLISDVWETAVETFYGHDAFGQSVELIGDETTNQEGDRCRLVKAPGFTTMFQAFLDNFSS